MSSADLVPCGGGGGGVMLLSKPASPSAEGFVTPSVRTDTAA